MAKYIGKHIELLDYFKVYFYYNWVRENEHVFSWIFDNSDGTCKYVSHKAPFLKLN